MKISKIALAVSLASVAAPAFAQDEDALRQQLEQMRAEMAQMAERMEALESRLAEPNANPPAPSLSAPAEPENDPSIEFKGMPEIKDKGGWSFKPRGRLQFDAGTVAAPDGAASDGGFGSEVRRARLGASGKLPGGFGYKVELDFAGSDLNVTDAIISYDAGAASLMVGQFNTFQGLEELTSSLHTSFIERAAFTDAFSFERRVGAAVVVNKGDVILQSGVFTDNMNDLSNKNWSTDSRLVYQPSIGSATLHVGGSIHYAELEQGETVRYRQRPLVHFTSDRFVNTDRMDAVSEFGLGLEGAFIAGPIHAVAEAYWQNVDVRTAAVDPTFFGGSVEVGYFLTKDDTRTFKGGNFGRTKPANPVGEGGFGSLQINARYDRLDLSDAGIIGGTQDGYFASLVWKPTDYTMLLANYGRLEYADAVLPTATGDRDYGVDVLAVRAQVDF
uniref:porin n=1 Tax=uncultured Erythrobacter sp. TaxID=263913 RepID=UPI0026052BF5|nr:porin [uncultured Erythrobacter sp.]